MQGASLAPVFHLSWEDQFEAAGSLGGMEPFKGPIESAGTPADPAGRLAALERLHRRLQSEGASLHLLLDLLDAALQPADLSSLFADVDDAPALPTAESAQAAAACAATTTMHLQLVTQLIEALGAQELGLEALAVASAAEGAAVPPGPAGSVVIEEMVDEGPGARVPLEAVLVAVLYCADPQLQLQRPWAVGQVAAAAQQLLLALAAKLAPLLAGWEQSQQSGESPLLQEVSTARSGGRSTAGQQAPPREVQQLLVLIMPAAVQQLRPLVAAKVDHGNHTTARLEPYIGPGNFERCVAAGQLAWLLRQLSGQHLSAASSAALPALLAAVEDPFPSEQACGLWALQHLAAEGQAADLRVHGPQLLGAAKHALAGCSDTTWPAAAAAAIAVTTRLEGIGPYSQVSHDIMAVLLDEGDRGAHLMERAAAWLAATPPLFTCLGLQLAAHFSRLMPLLLGWCLAPRWSVRAAALEALLEVVRQTWPRMGAHAAILWHVLRRVHEEELQRRLQLPAGSSQAARAVADCAEDCALALWFAAGTDFQVQLMTSQDGARDELLQAVMQRLEESAMAEPRQDSIEKREAA